MAGNKIVTHHRPLDRAAIKAAFDELLTRGLDEETRGRLRQMARVAIERTKTLSVEPASGRQATPLLDQRIAELELPKRKKIISISLKDKGHG